MLLDSVKNQMKFSHNLDNRDDNKDVSSLTSVERPLPSASSSIGAREYTHSSGVTVRLQNVVSTVNLGTTVNLKRLATSAENTEYNPRRFAAVIMRIREPKTTALIFSSGKMVCTGAKTVRDSKLAAKKYEASIRKTGVSTTFSEFKIQNIVGSCDFNHPIDIEGLSAKHQGLTTYEPETFPGLVYHLQDPKVALLIFVSGKVVFTGAKRTEDIYRTFEYIYPIICQHQKTLSV